MAIDGKQIEIGDILRHRGAKTSAELYSQYGAPHYSPFSQFELRYKESHSESGEEECSSGSGEEEDDSSGYEEESHSKEGIP